MLKTLHRKAGEREEIQGRRRERPTGRFSRTRPPLIPPRNLAARDQSNRNMNTSCCRRFICAPTPATTCVNPAKPGPAHFISDESEAADVRRQRRRLKSLCDEALTKKACEQFIVVTINSLADYGASGWPIERLRDGPDVGDGASAGRTGNYGMLLLVSRAIAKARIRARGQLGRRKDDDGQARHGRADHTTKFKQGDYSKGILAGVKGMHDVALEAVPQRNSPDRAGLPDAGADLSPPDHGSTTDPASPA